MDKIVAYLRVSTSKQDLNNQKLEILEYARINNLQISNFVEIVASSQKGVKQRRIDNLLERLEDANTLIVTELSRLGRSTVEVIDFINNLIKQKIRIIVLKQNLDIKHKHDIQSKVMVTIFSLIGELERDLISSRTKEALSAKKAQGQKLGKPRGTLQKSKFDSDIPKIKELLNYGLSIRKIAKVLGYTNHISLSVYIKKRRENILNFSA